MLLASLGFVSAIPLLIPLVAHYSGYPFTCLAVDIDIFQMRMRTRV